MKQVKKVKSTLITLIVIASFSNCATTQKIEKSTSLKFGEVYYHNLSEDVKGGGTDFNLFIPITSNPNNIILDSVYFKGKQVKLVYTNDSLAVGYFKTDNNKHQDIIMSNEPYAEYGNKIPKLPKKTPFKLNANACAVSYLDDSKVKYLKIEGVIKK